MGKVKVSKLSLEPKGQFCKFQAPKKIRTCGKSPNLEGVKQSHGKLPVSFCFLTSTCGVSTTLVAYRPVITTSLPLSKAHLDLWDHL